MMTIIEKKMIELLVSSKNLKMSAQVQI